MLAWFSHFWSTEEAYQSTVELLQRELKTFTAAVLQTTISTKSYKYGSLIAWIDLALHGLLHWVWDLDLEQLPMDLFLTHWGTEAFELLSQHFSNGLGDYLPELHSLVGAELAKLKDEAIKFTLTDLLDILWRHWSFDNLPDSKKFPTDSGGMLEFS